jgi:hypothetical protein
MSGKCRGRAISLNKKILVLSYVLILLTGICSVSQKTYAQSAKIPVGVFYYAWYNGTGSSTCPDSGHWNSTTTPQWAVEDNPLIGFYNSSDPNVIKQQLEEFKEIGIDFLIISWWGPNSFEDDAAKTIFSVIKQYDYPVQVAIMVEAYNWSGIYDFKAIFGYINSTYVAPYGSIYMKLNDLPLVCFFNDNINMTATEENRTAIYSVTGFSARIIGQSSYVDWYAWKPCSVDSNETPVINSNDSVVIIEPRYDGSHISQGANSAFDPTYSQRLYDNQWNYVLNNKDKIKFVLIYSWNEYHERSQIEPCYQSFNQSFDPYYCYDKTLNYTNQLETASSSWPPVWFLIASGILGTVVVLGVVTFYFRRRIRWAREELGK